MGIKRKYERPDWRDDLQEGDVLSNGRTFRVVRGVSYWKHGPSKGLLWGVSVSIQRCSWTGRCFTLLTASDLLTLGFAKVEGVRVKLNTELDRRIHRDVHGSWRSREASCCDVIGVVS